MTCKPEVNDIMGDPAGFLAPEVSHIMTIQPVWGDRSVQDALCSSKHGVQKTLLSSRVNLGLVVSAYSS